MFYFEDVDVQGEYYFNQRLDLYKIGFYLYEKYKIGVFRSKRRIGSCFDWQKEKWDFS